MLARGLAGGFQKASKRLAQEAAGRLPKGCQQAGFQGETRRLPGGFHEAFPEGFQDAF
jgi:hypothetical protein